MSYRLAVAKLSDIVRIAVPITNGDVPFTLVMGADDGRVATIDDKAAGDRYFEWRVETFPSFDESFPTCRTNVPMILRIRYERDRDVQALETKMVEDLITIYQALRVPSDWDMATTGIKSLNQNGDPGTLSLGSDDNPHAAILEVPFQLRVEQV